MLVKQCISWQPRPMNQVNCGVHSRQGRILLMLFKLSVYQTLVFHKRKEIYRLTSKISETRQSMSSLFQNILNICIHFAQFEFRSDLVSQSWELWIAKNLKCIGRIWHQHVLLVVEKDITASGFSENKNFHK